MSARQRHWEQGSRTRARLGAGFELLESVREEHRTPSGTLRRFRYSLLGVAD
jgi:hypothetical protein